MEIDPNRQNAVCVTRFVPDSTQMVFLYLGVMGGLFLRPLDFVRLSGAATRNLAMFRDFSDTYFHGYNLPEWSDLDSALKNQREILAACPKANELFCAGTSTGAYSAILFGHYLGADRVHAFAPRTLLQADRFPADLEIPPQHRDLSQLLGQWNGKTRYYIYYAQDHAEDTQQAARLANCEGVELRPLPGKDHNVMIDIDPAELLANLFPPESNSP